MKKLFSANIINKKVCLFVILYKVISEPFKKNTVLKWCKNEKRSKSMFLF